MIEQAQITDQFQALLEMLQQAERLYADLAAAAGDPQLKAQLEQLRRGQRFIDRGIGGQGYLAGVAQAPPGVAAPCAFFCRWRSRYF